MKSSTNEPIAGASILVAGTSYGAASAADGTFRVERKAEQLFGTVPYGLTSLAPAADGGLWVLAKLKDGETYRMYYRGLPAVKSGEEVIPLSTSSIVAAIAAGAILLIFFATLALLEDVGYMARAAFVMDRFMHLVGLHGKSFIPMLSSFACAIPGIMATRTITNTDGTVIQEEYVQSEARVETITRKDGTKVQRVVQYNNGGSGAFMDGKDLFEFHTIYVKAFDKAGNEAESEKVRILVRHKPKEAKTP